MTDSKHTPGPGRTDENGHIVCYPDGLSIGVLSKQLPEGELKANHQLIVAAPELLEALTALVDIDENCGPFGGELYRDRVERAFDAARAAIAKATT
jgi:hypothetical protein